MNIPAGEAGPAFDAKGAVGFGVHSKTGGGVAVGTPRGAAAPTCDEDSPTPADVPSLGPETLAGKVTNSLKNCTRSRVECGISETSECHGTHYS